MTRRRGFTLVEALVALVLGSLVLAVAAAGSVSVRRMAATLEARGTASQRATAVPALLGGALALAGRGLDGCGLQVDGGGARLRMLGVESAGTATAVELFADLDGGGRPALYRRTPPFARQPWLEDVVAFAVSMGRDGDGAWRRVDHDDRTRWSALRVELAWSDGDRRTYDLPLPQAPCAGVLP
jgi:prepilin-type N-terminal cleavage/methylation domain-containing protein